MSLDDKLTFDSVVAKQEAADRTMFCFADAFDSDDETCPVDKPGKATFVCAPLPGRRHARGLCIVSAARLREVILEGDAVFPSRLAANNKAFGDAIKRAIDGLAMVEDAFHDLNRFHDRFVKLAKNEIPLTTTESLDPKVQQHQLEHMARDSGYALWMLRNMSASTMRLLNDHTARMTRCIDETDWALRCVVDVASPWGLCDIAHLIPDATRPPSATPFDLVASLDDIDPPQKSVTGLPARWEMYPGLDGNARVPSLEVSLSILCSACTRWITDEVIFGADPNDVRVIDDRREWRTRLTGHGCRRNVCCSQCGIMMRHWFRAYAPNSMRAVFLVPLRMLCELPEESHTCLVEALNEVVKESVRGRCLVRGAGEALSDDKLRALLGSAWWEFSDSSVGGARVYHAEHASSRDSRIGCAFSTKARARAWLR